MCGIIGVFKKRTKAVFNTYDGLLMLQHRGQDASGMVSFDGGNFYEKRGNGLVSEIFDEQDIKKLKGNFALGHTRYPTAGSDTMSEAQPFFVNSPLGIYLIHNGNLTNAKEEGQKVREKYYRHLRTDSDTEILLNNFADKIYETMKNGEKNLEKIVFNSIKKLMQEIRGGYSVICLIDKVGMVAFRDPHGIRPLSLGTKLNSIGSEYCFASEDVVFQGIDFKKIRDIKPGEAVLINLDGEIRENQCMKGQLNPCIFEYIYLARPESIIDEISVYKTRLRLGHTLAKQVKKANLEIDTIIPVPDSSRPMALELSKDLGIKYREGLVKNRYVGRTFIMPNQKIREKSVKRKLNTIPLEFKNRNVLLVDDSIVRGTTMKKIVEMCREAGAKKVFVASAAPPVRFPNVYGVDMPTRKELIANNLEIPEIEKLLGIDKLFYQTMEDMIWAAKEGNPKIENFDCSCFDGKYVTGDIDEKYLKNLEESTRVTQRSLPTIY